MDKINQAVKMVWIHETQKASIEDVEAVKLKMGNI